MGQRRPDDAVLLRLGLEIRREIARGELSDARRAALPVAAALGGMVLPALLFVAINFGHETASGWGIPMATDIAFAVGVLAVLGRRVPAALRILLLAIAVIDDVGAILVIGIFYSGPLSVTGLAIAGVGVLGVFVMQRLGVRSPWLYVVPGAVLWQGIHTAGIHPTLAGVILGLMTPAAAWFTRDAFVEVTSRAVEAVEEREADPASQLDVLEVARREAVAPVDLLQRALHRTVAFGIMPLFAFANAGVTVGSVSFNAPATRSWSASRSGS